MNKKVRRSWDNMSQLGQFLWGFGEAIRLKYVRTGEAVKV
jgi:hypothetical protein